MVTEKKDSDPMVLFVPRASVLRAYDKLMADPHMRGVQYVIERAELIEDKKPRSSDLDTKTPRVERGPRHRVRPQVFTEKWQYYVEEYLSDVTLEPDLKVLLTLVYVATATTPDRVVSTADLVPIVKDLSPGKKEKVTPRSLLRLSRNMYIHLAGMEKSIPKEGVKLSDREQAEHEAKKDLVIQGTESTMWPGARIDEIIAMLGGGATKEDLRKFFDELLQRNRSSGTPGMEFIEHPALHKEYYNLGVSLRIQGGVPNAKWGEELDRLLLIFEERKRLWTAVEIEAIHGMLQEANPLAVAAIHERARKTG